MYEKISNKDIDFKFILKKYKNFELVKMYLYSHV